MSCVHPLIFSCIVPLTCTFYGLRRRSPELFLFHKETESVSPHVGVGLQEGVDAVDDPAEETAVQGLGHGVADVGGFVHGVGADDGLAPGDHTLGGQRLLELLGPDAEEGGG